MREVREALQAEVFWEDGRGFVRMPLDSFARMVAALDGDLRRGRQALKGGEVRADTLQKQKTTLDDAVRNAANEYDGEPRHRATTLARRLRADHPKLTPATVRKILKPS